MSFGKQKNNIKLLWIISREKSKKEWRIFIDHQRIKQKITKRERNQFSTNFQIIIIWKLEKKTTRKKENWIHQISKNKFKWNFHFCLPAIIYSGIIMVIIIIICQILTHFFSPSIHSFIAAEKNHSVIEDIWFEEQKMNAKNILENARFCFFFFCCWIINYERAREKWRKTNNTHPHTHTEYSSRIFFSFFSFSGVFKQTYNIQKKNIFSLMIRHNQHFIIINVILFDDQKMSLSKIMQIY